MTGKEFVNRIANGKSDIIQVFLDILSKTGSRYCLIGGLAVNAYVEPVASLDMDVVAVNEDVAAICKAAKELGLKILATAERAGAGEQFEHSVNLTSANSDLRIQLYSDPRYQKFVSNADGRNVLGYTMRVARLEDVLQGKVWAYSDKTRRKSKRQKDLADIFRIVEKFPHLEASLPQTIREELNK